MIESMANSQDQFRDLIGEANRTSTSFYTVDVKGLRAAGRPGTTIAPAERRAADPKVDPFVEMRNRERLPIVARVEDTSGQSDSGQCDDHADRASAHAAHLNSLRAKSVIDAARMAPM
jgi:hypothetical protein